MRLVTKFDIGDTVWSVTRYYDKDVLNAESCQILFYDYNLEGPYTVNQILLSVKGDEIVISYKFKEIEAMYSQDWLYKDYEVALSTFSVNKSLARKVKEDYNEKYGGSLINEDRQY